MLRVSDISYMELKVEFESIIFKYRKYMVTGMMLIPYSNFP